MFKKLLEYLFKDFYIFTAAYSNNVFPDPLSKEEEEKYVDLCLKGDKMARDILIEHNLRLVAHIVKKYDHKKEDADDLISIGTIGLIKGIDSFSYKHGNEITFLDILKTPKPDFALDLHKQNNLNLLKKYFKVLNDREKDIIIKRYGLDGNDEITQKEIAKEMGISRSYVSRIEKRALTKMLREYIKNKNNSY